MRLELFPFRFRDPLTGKWVRARYVAERHVIAERYAECEITARPRFATWTRMRVTSTRSARRAGWIAPQSAATSARSLPLLWLAV